MGWFLPHGHDSQSSLLVRYRWGFLLVVLLTAFLIEPLFGAGMGVGLVGLFLYITVFSGMVRLAHLSPRVQIFAYVIIAIWSALSLAQHFVEHSFATHLLLFLSAVISIGALIVTFTELMRPDVLSIDKLFGAIFGYFLIALAMALLYVQIEVLKPGSFDRPSAALEVSEFLYFSLVTVTTLGYGDIKPVARIAQILSGLEAATGTLYIAILIGQIVGSMRR